VSVCGCVCVCFFVIWLLLNRLRYCRDIFVGARCGQHAGGDLMTLTFWSFSSCDFYLRLLALLSEASEPLLRLALIYRRPYDIMFHMIKSIVDSTKVVPCLLFDEIEILIPDDSLSICPSLDNSGVFIRYKNKEKLLYWSSSSNLSGCAKALCPFHSSIHWLNFCAYHYFFMTCNIEYLFLLPVIPRKCVCCLRHCKILWFCQ